MPPSYDVFCPSPSAQAGVVRRVGVVGGRTRCPSKTSSSRRRSRSSRWSRRRGAPRSAWFPPSGTEKSEGSGHVPRGTSETDRDQDPRPAHGLPGVGTRGQSPTRRMWSPRLRSASAGVDSLPALMRTTLRKTIGTVRTCSPKSGLSCTWKCRCGTSESPESPTAAICWPSRTRSPLLTRALPCWRCASTA